MNLVSVSGIMQWPKGCFIEHEHLTCCFVLSFHSITRCVHVLPFSQVNQIEFVCVLWWSFRFPIHPGLLVVLQICTKAGSEYSYPRGRTGTTVGEFPINRIVDGKLKTDVVVAFGPLTLFNETRENVVLLCGRKMVVFWLLFSPFLSRQQAVSDSIHSIISRPVSMSLQTLGLWLEFY